MEWDGGTYLREHDILRNGGVSGGCVGFGGVFLWIGAAEAVEREDDGGSDAVEWAGEWVGVSEEGY